MAKKYKNLSDKEQWEREEKHNNIVLSVILFFAIVLFLLVRFVFQINIVEGESMQPTYHNKDVVIAYKTHDVRKQEIAIIDVTNKDNSDEERHAIKRVIATSGDTVEINKGVLYLNDKPQLESYLGSNSSSIEYPRETVPPNMYFVLGDNRTKSKDSRIYGLVSDDEIMAKVLFRIRQDK